MSTFHIVKSTPELRTPDNEKDVTAMWSNPHNTSDDTSAVWISGTRVGHSSRNVSLSFFPKKRCCGTMSPRTSNLASINLCVCPEISIAVWRPFKRGNICCSYLWTIFTCIAVLPDNQPTCPFCVVMVNDSPMCIYQTISPHSNFEFKKQMPRPTYWKIQNLLLKREVVVVVKLWS